jgi:hypothetical protein
MTFWTRGILKSVWRVWVDSNHGKSLYKKDTEVATIDERLTLMSPKVRLRGIAAHVDGTII